MNSCSDNNTADKIAIFREKLEQADAVIIGAGAGLSTSAGFVYSGERFEKYFSDFGQKYPFRDMYSGGFYPYKTMEEYWGYWSRYIYINRYMDAPIPVYQKLFHLMKEKDYFVLTTNVDHCFQKAGFDKNRLFYTQGDYGLFQCSKPCHKETYDNEKIITDMVLNQGFRIRNGQLFRPEDGKIKRMVPRELIPCCPRCGRPMSMNLRADATFVEDKGWHLASERYARYLQKHKRQRIVYMELGVGYNTPGIIKYPFWQMTAENPKATYVCINREQAICPEEIKKQSICIDGDIGEILTQL